MTFPEDPDKPPFDLVRFEADAQARAAELIAQVSRLAVVHIPVEEPANSWLAERGARYDLADETRIEVKHETYDLDPSRVTVKTRVTTPPTEILGHDYLLRRVTLSRCVLFQSFSEDIEGPEAGDNALPPPAASDEVERLGKVMEGRLQEERLEYQADPDYRPLELIDAWTVAHVECKLPGDKPNFRTERLSANMPGDTKLAHMAARRQASEQGVENPEYSVAEHKALMAQLAGIDPALADPQPLDSEFDDTGLWERIDYSNIARSWRPRPSQE